MIYPFIQEQERLFEENQIMIEDALFGSAQDSYEKSYYQP